MGRDEGGGRFRGRMVEGGELLKGGMRERVMDGEREGKKGVMEE
jgi:hypothetical protein